MCIRDSSCVEPFCDVSEAEIDTADESGVHHHGGGDDDRVANHLGAARPSHLAHLITHLTEILRRSDPLARRLGAGRFGGRSALVQGALAPQSTLLFTV